MNNQKDRFAWIREDRGEDDPDFVDAYLDFKRRVSWITKTSAWVGGVLGLILVVMVVFAVPLDQLLERSPVKLLVVPLVLAMTGYLMSLGTMLVWAPHKVFESPEGRKVMETIGTSKKSVARVLISIFVLLGAGFCFIMLTLAYMISKELLNAV